ncbi:prophage tail length tape measure protein [Janthinobacterium sp. HH103]|uniref:phage tail length tape measure family protein n=1 Tax=unclassified Janthinobacterium TaxID=2610881 RepID=UPI000873FCC0|nr:MULTISPECIES: phage tail length tape measure family protein [unclassified Janthinobacterium]OEZ66309.1 prophage tail length tape measure protein [Janthinobacterium sp. HH100]OEZ89344.1 prophage tail length tape measure protein [Janthinobacterium sp. HH103]
MSEIIGSATIAVGVDSTAAESGFAKIGAAGTRTGKSLDNLSGKAGKGFSDIGTAGDASSKKVESATRNMIGSIQRTIATLESGSKSSAKYYETLASQRGVNVDVLKPYLAQLDSVAAKQKLAENALRSTDPVMKEFGISSAQTTAALRQMPAQLTDIFTSLAGGQNPLLVLIQQGGQIKDAFGGVSNTVKILGNEVASFFSSSASAASAAAGIADVGGALADVAKEQQAASAGIEQVGAGLSDLAGQANTTAEAVANTRIAMRGVGTVSLGMVAAVALSVAAVAGAAVAYYQGSKEITAYRTALVMTGNAAGTSAGQLADMARGISKNVGTQGAAAESLAALAATGRVAAENLERFATVSVRAQKALSISAIDLASDFSELGKTPLDALESLNEKYRFLTASTYSQINALVDQGKTTEAAKVAQNAYADMVESRSKSVTESLGYLERAWASLGSGAKTAWDYMLNIGREDTLGEKLKDAEAALKLAKQRRFTFVGAGADGKADLIAAEKRVALLRDQKDAIESNAQLQAIDRQLQDSFIDWAKEGDKYLTRRQQMEKELEASRNRGLEAGASEEQLAERGLEIQKKYADLFNGGIDTQIEAIRRRGAIEEVVSERSMAALVANRDAGLATSLDAQIKFSQTVADLDIKDFNRRKSLLMEELSLTKGKANSEKEQAALRGQAALIDAQIASRRRTATNEQFVLDVKATRAAASDYADLVDKRDADVAAIKKQVIEQTTANSLIGKSKKQIADFNAVQQEEVATRKELDAAILDTILGREKEAELLRAQAAEIRNLSAAQREGAQKSTDFEANKAMLESLDRTAKDTFVSIFDSGKSTFDRLRDTLKNGLFDLLYQMTVRKWVLNIGASVSGTGSAGLASAAVLGDTGTASSFGSVGGLLQSAKTAYTMVTQGFAGITAGLGTSVVSLGTLFGSTAIEAFGAGLGSTGLVGAADAAGLYAASGGVGSAGAVTAGAYAGAAVTAAAGIAAGVLGGKLISGQYGSNSTVNVGTGIGAVAGAFMGGPIGAAIGGALGGLIGGLGNRVFGMGDKKYGETGITGTLSGTGFSGTEYAKWTQKGGWLRSDKSDTDRKAVDATTSNAFVETYAAIRNVSATLANTLGIDTSSLATRAQALNINLTGLTTEADRLGAVTKFFEGVGNAIAVELLPNVGQFKQGNEELSVTLQRVAGNYAGVDAALQLIGRTSQEAFGAVGVATIGARENLIKLAGSLDSLSSGTSFFAENFLTEAEKMAPVLSTVADTLGKLGMSGVKTVDQYKQVVLGLDLASTSGQEMYIKLLALAPAFKSAADYTALLSGAVGGLAEVSKTASEIASERKGLQAELDKLTLNALQLRAKERLSIDASNRALFDEVSARSDVAAAYATQSDALKSAIERLKTFASGIQTFKDSLQLGTLSTLTPVQKMMEAQRQYEETLAKARAGDSTAQAALTAAASAYLSADQIVKASSDAYTADVTRVQSDLAALAALAGTQMTEAEKQLSVLDQQVGQLVTLNSTAVAMKDAIIALGRSLVAGGKADITAGMLDGSHASGLARVPFDGYRAELHQGEVVVDAQAAAAMRRYFGGAPQASGGNTDALVAEIKALREEVKGLRADQERQTGDVLGATAEAHRGTADAIVSGTERALDRAAYNQQTKQRGIPA